MKKYLCSHWALNPADRDWVKSMGFSGLRFDIPWAAPKEYVRKAFNTMAANKLEVLAIIGGWCLWDAVSAKPKPRKAFTPPLQAVGLEAKRIASILVKSNMPLGLVAFELGNEPDLSEWNSPREFADFVNRGASGVWEAIPTATVITGGVSNVNRKGGARYLDRMLDAGIDPRILLGVHTHRWDQIPSHPPKGWDSIQDMFRWLRSKGRVFFVTEGGWHSAPQTIRRGPFGLCKKSLQWDDNEIADFAEVEMGLWNRAGCGCYSWYQINDGPNRLDREDNFGVRYHDLAPKPVAKAFQDMWEVA